MPPLSTSKAHVTLSHVTLSYVAVSSISFFLSSTQALCAQLQIQKNHQRDTQASAVLPTDKREKAKPRVFIITTRRRRTGTSKLRFSAKRAESPSYFAQHAGIPPETGKKADPTSVNLRIEQLQKDDFFKALEVARDKCSSHKIAVFVHGYNSDMKVPLKLATTLSTEVDMPVVLFSWPSKRNPLTYTEDECNAEWSAFHLAHFLENMQLKLGNENIVLVGHSLGCRVICWALKCFQSDGIPNSDKSFQFERTLHSDAKYLQSNTKYNHILFCSPDIDEEIFKINIPLLERKSSSTLVYASTRDIRLNFSQLLHGNPRLGLLKVSLKEANAKDSGTVQIIDYTKDNRSLFGHSIPFKLIASIFL